MGIEIIHGYRDVEDITTQEPVIFQSGISPKADKNRNPVLTRGIEALKVVPKTR
jgi:hypothetical protein